MRITPPTRPVRIRSRSAGLGVVPVHADDESHADELLRAEPVPLRRRRRRATAARRRRGRGACRAARLRDAVVVVGPDLDVVLLKRTENGSRHSSSTLAVDRQPPFVPSGLEHQRAGVDRDREVDGVPGLRPAGRPTSNGTSSKKTIGSVPSPVRRPSRPRSRRRRGARVASRGAGSPDPTGRGSGSRSRTAPAPARSATSRRRPR